MPEYTGGYEGYDSEGKCIVCRLSRTPRGHDPCIADLPGVDHACCGHGGQGYISFSTGRIIRFQLRSVERLGDTDEGYTWDEWPISPNETPWFSPEYDPTTQRRYYSATRTDGALSGKGVWVREVEATPPV